MERVDPESTADHDASVDGPLSDVDRNPRGRREGHPTRSELQEPFDRPAELGRARSSRVPIVGHQQHASVTGGGERGKVADDDVVERVVEGARDPEGGEAGEGQRHDRHDEGCPPGARWGGRSGARALPGGGG